MICGVSARELDAAGIGDPGLRASYETCRRLNAQHGKTYYLATRLLPPAKRPYVHALYGFARYADEIVDDLASTRTPQKKAAWLNQWGEAFLRDLKAGRSDDPVCRAVVDTVQRWSIPVETFQAFLHSMRMDLTITEYQTYDDLLEYVYGSAAVIGLQMVPILEPVGPGAEEAAQALGVAFQLANFVRDVGEDLDRGRVYLPLADLERFGVSRSDLERRVVTEPVRAALRYQIARVRRLSHEATPGIAALHPTSRPCIEAAQTLYVGIVDEVEAIDFQVFTRRARTSTTRRARVAGRAWWEAIQARRQAARPSVAPQPAGRRGGAAKARRRTGRAARHAPPTTPTGRG
jgi:phytoene synthase